MSTSLSLGKLYIIDTPFGYMVAPRKLKFFGMEMSKYNIHTMSCEMHTMCLTITHALYKDKQTGTYHKDEFITDAINNNCELYTWSKNKLPLPCFKEKCDAMKFKEVLEARQVLCLMNE